MFRRQRGVRRKEQPLLQTKPDWVFKKDLSVCETGKVCYLSESHANQVLLAARNLGETNRQQIPIRSYKCPFCEYWHLTKQNNKFVEREP